jgi:hypothetical protein
MSSLPRAGHFLLAAVAFPLSVLPGCGPSGPKIVKIEGTVTRDGKPLKGFQVHFDPEHGRPSVAKTDEQGHYALDYTPKIKGAVVGKHKVYVWYFPDDPKNRLAQEEGRWKPPADIQAVLKKYGPDKTPLRFDIDKSQTIDLKLDD